MANPEINPQLDVAHAEVVTLQHLLGSAPVDSYQAFTGIVYGEGVDVVGSISRFIRQSAPIASQPLSGLSNHEVLRVASTRGGVSFSAQVQSWTNSKEKPITSVTLSQETVPYRNPSAYILKAVRLQSRGEDGIIVDSVAVKVGDQQKVLHIAKFDPKVDFSKLKAKGIPMSGNYQPKHVNARYSTQEALTLFRDTLIKLTGSLLVASRVDSPVLPHKANSEKPFLRIVK